MWDAFHPCRSENKRMKRQNTKYHNHDFSILTKRFFSVSFRHSTQLYKDSIFLLGVVNVHSAHENTQINPDFFWLHMFCFCFLFTFPSSAFRYEYVVNTILKALIAVGYPMMLVVSLRKDTHIQRQKTPSKLTPVLIHRLSLFPYICVQRLPKEAIRKYRYLYFV